ncbi:hypothetical protein FRC03_010045 [Tulasnella sp. 419]|nr:hypothetical protein FRC03_010045 [Tulasnella sp. 419]
MTCVNAQIADQKVERTISAVSWDKLQGRILQSQSVKSAHWGNPFSGAFNVIRFLHLHDANNTVLVARIPKAPNGGWTDSDIQAISRRLASEIATMRYVEICTKIPVPHVFDYSLGPDGDGVGSPYIIMSKVNGVPLSMLWHSMNETRRHAILAQVVEIYLELLSHRFEHIGCMFMDQNKKEPTWRIGGMVVMPDPDGGPTVTSIVSSRVFRSAFDFWTECVNGRLRTLRTTGFGHDGRKHDFMYTWIFQPHIRSLYNASLDYTGFPLFHHDLNAQNIIIIHGDTNPLISGIIDWEGSGTLPTSSVAKYPPFITNNLHWRYDHPLHERNIRDQDTFLKLMRKTESKLRDTKGPITQAIKSSYGPSLFEQVVQSPLFCDSLFPKVLDYIYGEGTSQSDFFISSLTKGLFHGVLCEVGHLFDKETEVYKEVETVLGKDKINNRMGKAEFEKVVLCHSSQFPTGVVHEWLIIQRNC